MRRQAQHERSESGASRLGVVRIAALAIAFAVAALLTLLPGATRLHETVFDAYQRIAPRDLSGMRARLVEIDSESLRLLGPWPWSRDTIARLTEQIGDKGAVAIGFDMLFPEPDRQSPELFLQRYRLPPAVRTEVSALPSLDEEFATALGRYPTVLARAGIAERSVDFVERIYRDPAALPVDARFAKPLPPGVARWPQALSSIPAIEETALGHGLVNGDPDPDGVLRRVPAVGLIGTSANPGFAVELARLALGVEAITPIARGGTLRAVRLGDRDIPVDPDGRFRLRFGRQPEGAAISAADLFRRGFDRRRIAGRVVVVGLTGAGGTDIVATPLEAQALGPFVQAQAVDAILAHAFLERPRWGWLAELAAGALLAALAVLLLPRLRGAVAWAVPVAAAGTIVATGWIGFLRFGVLLDPATPLAIGTAAGTTMLIGLFVEARRDRRALRAALVREQLAAARAAGEMEAAHGIQLGMLPLPGALAALDPALDVAALLEPARAVGGDFYDGFTLPDGRTAFLIGDVTGKGVPAALFMALAKALARSALERRPDDLAAAAALLNADLSRDNAEAMHVTMLIGAIGPDGHGELVNAGHENPLLVRGDGTVETLALAGGPPICVIDDFPYEAEPVTLAPGDGLVLVTDGVTEAQDRGGGFFDAARVDTALRALPPGWRAADASTALLAAVRAFEDGAEASDDLTVMALRLRATDDRTPVAYSSDRAGAVDLGAWSA